MTTTNAIIWRQTLKSGIITSVAFIIAHLFFVARGLSNTQQDYSGTINFFILVAGIIWFSVKFRNESNKGMMSYSQGMGIGTLMGLFSGVVFAVYLYIFYYFSPADIDNILSLIEEELMKNGDLTDDQIEALIQFYHHFMTPLSLAFATVFQYTFMGFLISLVTSLFIKKQAGSPFDNAMNEIS